MKIIIPIVCVLYFLACSKQEKIIFEKNYYENGTLKSVTPYLGGKMNGLYKDFHENGKLKTIIHFHRGKKEGVLAEFDNKGLQINESFFENDIEKLFKEYQYTKDLNFIKEEIFIINNDHSINVGEVVYNNEWEVIRDKSWYYSIKMIPDTIALGNTGVAFFEIFPYKDFSNIKIHVNVLNEMDSIYFSDSISIPDDKYSFELKGAYLGLNKIRGKIILETDQNEDGEYRSTEIPIYENFIVIKSL
jgi:hypothetical protein